METLTMSRTYRRTNDNKYSTAGKIKAENKKFLENVPEWKHWRHQGQRWIWIKYSKSPSHWNRDFSTKPRRARERELLSKLMKDELDADKVVFPDGKKPFIYYW
jgi:hypothetical protein